MASQRVPSPEEIRQQLALKNVGVELPIGAVADLERRIADVSSKVGKLRAKTPAELREALDLICEKYGMEPLEELVSMAMEKQPNGSWALSNDQRIKVLSELASYRMPKLKSVEVSGTMEHKHEIIIVRYGEDGIAKREPKSLNEPLCTPDGKVPILDVGRGE